MSRPRPATRSGRKWSESSLADGVRRRRSARPWRTRAGARRCKRGSRQNGRSSSHACHRDRIDRHRLHGQVPCARLSRRLGGFSGPAGTPARASRRPRPGGHRADCGRLGVWPLDHRLAPAGRRPGGRRGRHHHAQLSSPGDGRSGDRGRQGGLLREAARPRCGRRPRHGRGGSDGRGEHPGRLQLPARAGDRARQGDRRERRDRRGGRFSRQPLRGLHERPCLAAHLADAQGDRRCRRGRRPGLAHRQPRPPPGRRDRRGPGQRPDHDRRAPVARPAGPDGPGRGRGPGPGPAALRKRRLRLDRGLLDGRRAQDVPDLRDHRHATARSPSTRAA